MPHPSLACKKAAAGLRRSRGVPGQTKQFPNAAPFARLQEGGGWSQKESNDSAACSPAEGRDRFGPRFCGVRGRWTSFSRERINSGEPSGRPLNVESRIANRLESSCGDCRKSLQSVQAQRRSHRPIASQAGAGAAPQWAATEDQFQSREFRDRRNNFQMPHPSLACKKAAAGLRRSRMTARPVRLPRVATALAPVSAA
jgi:hypothetical protein